MKTPPFTRLLLAVVAMAVLSRSANAQLIADSVTPSSPAVSVSQAALLPQVAYARPTQKMKLRGYLFDAFGPYPIVGAALAAGINQGENTRRNGSKTPKPTASDSAPTLASQG